MKKITVLLWVTVITMTTGLMAEKSSGDDSKNATKVDARMEAATTTLREIMGTPDKGIPKEILGDAKCVIVIPGMKKAGFVFGGRYGRGFATCRTENGWSAPAPVFLGGGSYGAQIGGEGVDLVLTVMNDAGVQHLLSSKFELGVDASAAAGPVGRSASAGTDWKMNTEMLSYSRAKGLFAGVELNGAKVRQDDDTTKQLYGRMIGFKEILSGQTQMPNAAAGFINEVRKDFAEARASK